MKESYSKEELDKLNEKVWEELMNIHDKKRMEQLEHKMQVELEAGLYCLKYSSEKLIGLLKAVCWSDLEIMTTDKLNDFYRSTLANIKIILNYNEPVKKFHDCSELLNLIKLLPGVLTNSSLRITNWEEVMEVAFKFDSKVSEFCYVDTYTPPTDDSYTAELREIGKYIPEHWEMRERRTAEEIVNKVKETNSLDISVNSRLVKQKNKSKKIVIEEKTENETNKPKQLANKISTKQEKLFWLEKIGTEVHISSNSKKYKLKKADALSQYDMLMDFVLTQNKENILKKEWEEFCKKESGRLPTKTMPSILSYLGFTKELKRIFFPKCTATKITARVQIYNSDLKNLYVDVETLERLIQKEVT